MAFEKLIDESNAFYRAQNKAVIHKKPVPVQIVNVDYPRREMAKITEAYYQTPSTTDYNGIYKGKYIDFDAKESSVATSFALKNIHPHQIEHLASVALHGGIAFILIMFKKQDTVHLLPIEPLLTFVKRAEKGRKSITYEEVLTHGILVEQGYRPSIDYIKAVDQLIAR